MHVLIGEFTEGDRLVFFVVESYLVVGEVGEHFADYLKINVAIQMTASLHTY